MSDYRATQVDHSDPIINFAIGQPDFDLLPHALLRRAAEERFGEGDTEFLNYGYEQGDERFRVALAGFLQTQYADAVDPGSLMVTAGASQALDQICTLYTRPGDTVFVEEPSYFIALRILLEDHRLVPVALACDEEGLDIEALEAALTRHRPTLLYTIPTFQNPTGRTLPAARRERLVELAQKHDFLIVADEVYHPLYYTTRPPIPLAGRIDTGHVLSIGSFSKILAPGLRLGWVQAAQQHIQRFVTSGLVDSGGGLNHFSSNLVRVVLEEGWQLDYLQGLRAEYRARIQLMAERLMAGLDEDVRFSIPDGGYFFWLTFPDHVDTARLLPPAHEKGVGFLPGSRCSSQGGQRNALRLSFAHYGRARIEEGIGRLVEVLADWWRTEDERRKTNHA